MDTKDSIPYCLLLMNFTSYDHHSSVLLVLKTCIRFLKFVPVYDWCHYPSWKMQFNMLEIRTQTGKQCKQTITIYYRSVSSLWKNLMAILNFVLFAVILLLLDKFLWINLLTLRKETIELQSSDEWLQNFADALLEFAVIKLSETTS